MKKGLQRGRGALQTWVPTAGVCNIVLLCQINPPALPSPALERFRGLGTSCWLSWPSASLQEHLALLWPMEDGTQYRPAAPFLGGPLCACCHQHRSHKSMVAMARGARVALPRWPGRAGWDTPLEGDTATCNRTGTRPRVWVCGVDPVTQ